MDCMNELTGRIRPHVFMAGMSTNVTASLNLSYTATILINGHYEYVLLRWFYSTFYDIRYE